MRHQRIGTLYLARDCSFSYRGDHFEVDLATLTRQIRTVIGTLDAYARTPFG